MTIIVFTKAEVVLNIAARFLICDRRFRFGDHRFLLSKRCFRLADHGGYFSERRFRWIDRRFLTLRVPERTGEPRAGGGPHGASFTRQSQASAQM